MENSKKDYNSYKHDLNSNQIEKFNKFNKIVSNNTQEDENFDYLENHKKKIIILERTSLHSSNNKSIKKDEIFDLSQNNHFKKTHDHIKNNITINQKNTKLNNPKLDSYSGILKNGDENYDLKYSRGKGQDKYKNETVKLKNLTNYNLEEDLNNEFDNNSKPSIQPINFKANNPIELSKKNNNLYSNLKRENNFITDESKLDSGIRNIYNDKISSYSINNNFKNKF